MTLEMLDILIFLNEKVLLRSMVKHSQPLKLIYPTSVMLSPAAHCRVKQSWLRVRQGGGGAEAIERQRQAQAVRELGQLQQ